MDDLTGDGAVLAAAIEAHHPDPFRSVSRDLLLREAAQVDALSSNNRSALAVALMRTLRAMKLSLPLHLTRRYRAGVERLFAEVASEFVDERKLRDLLALLRGEPGGPV